MNHQLIRVSVWTGFIFGSAMLVARADYYNVYGGSDGYSPSYSAPYSYSQLSRSSGPPVSLDLNPQENLNSSFRIAAREGRLEDMKAFLRQGAGVNSRSESGETALMYGARNCSEAVVKFLLESKAEVNLRSDQGETALMMAAEDSCLPVVKLLLRVPGLRRGEKDREGRTALDYAVDQTTMEVGGPSDEIVRLLNRPRPAHDRKERL